MMGNAGRILALLKEHYKNPRPALNFSNALELLVATMLSAQCTDERVNKVTSELFKKYRSARDYADAELDELEKDIRPTGFYKNKAQNLKNACRILADKFSSQVPKRMGELMELPGVGRKTANIVLSSAYNVTEGIAVDTHVRRLANRLGLAESADVEKIEEELMKLFDRREWPVLTLLLMEHGRKTCLARNPKCSECFLMKLCPGAEKEKK